MTQSERMNHEETLYVALLAVHDRVASRHYDDPDLMRLSVAALGQVEALTGGRLDASVGGRLKLSIQKAQRERLRCEGVVRAR